jgi:ankyrin repeat protein
MLAAANGHRNSVRMMLGYRAKAYLQDKNGKKSADYARENGHPETARMLEMHQHILNRAAGAAVNAGKKGEAKYYLCEGADPAALEKTGAQFLNITSD